MSVISRLRTSIHRRRKPKEQKLAAKRWFQPSEALIDVFPYDDDELDRLQQLHYSMKYAWVGNYSSPVHEVLSEGNAKVLEIGCKMGTWLVDMSLQYPNSSFTGVDYRQFLPTDTGPPNVTFIAEDVLDGLPFSDDTFDFVFMRFMGWRLSQMEWVRIINELTRVARPGGWIEIMETDMIWYNEGPNAQQFRRGELFSKYRVNMVMSHLIPHHFKSTGAVDKVLVKQLSIPIGGWGGKIGYIHAFDTRWICRNLKRVVASFGLDNDRYSLLVDDIMNEIELSNVYENCYRFYAQKKAYTYY
ncbi:6773_t:CDS:2 [Paraglomus occultum]|uniref:6773_t:CDS:1 n=1 Tax=Paraglomus occultum TaxID=144539 RepID=A0A9N8VGQ9_9GLOM|nr:6773_t:CDS:2 [Paraglomus occultum]